MPEVLTAASTLQCAHRSPLVVVPSQSALTVDGQPVLLVADLLAATVPACPNVGTGLTPCGKVTALTAGTSTLLLVHGAPVALATARGTTAAFPVPPVGWQVVSAGQNRLIAD
ncbi:MULTISPECIES: hypothetical protein [unclassified Streptomyces]|uniref:hypothetical protein n=1 Tax=unclassified Streptomyces TaxID=2593676 RepID=UPI0016611B92|nr:MULTISPECIES: hypothetical protein [unclassified Streptomyces]MBD0708188.1 hypothetical protein [Streptomyces sp. CBMA291]MBD0714502.1 hypothetical protein [Streptomyces sp. CBMA370]